MNKEIDIEYELDETYDNTTPSRTFTNSSQRESYRIGDGDTPVYIRQSALDFKKLPSRGQK